MNEPQKTGHSKRGLLLTGSVALNLFLLGVVAATVLGPMSRPPFPPQGFPPPPPEMMMARLADGMNPADAKVLREIYAERRELMKANHEAMREKFHRLAALLGAERPDLVALKAALADIDSSGRRVHEGMGKALERAATELSLDARRKLAAFLDHPPEGPRPEKMGRRSFGPRDRIPPVPEKAE
jgi:uncharacterized membrane protein